MDMYNLGSDKGEWKPVRLCTPFRGSEKEVGADRDRKPQAVACGVLFLRSAPIHCAEQQHGEGSGSAFTALSSRLLLACPALNLPASYPLQHGYNSQPPSAAPGNLLQPI